VYSRLAGNEDLNDAARLATDPTFRLTGSPNIWDRGAALTSTLHWFETELLTREENLVGLMGLTPGPQRYRPESHSGANGLQNYRQNPSVQRVLMGKLLPDPAGLIHNYRHSPD
jgi:hypothetical protein